MLKLTGNQPDFQHAQQQIRLSSAVAKQTAHCKNSVQFGKLKPNIHMKQIVLAGEVVVLLAETCMCTSMPHIELYNYVHVPRITRGVGTRYGFQAASFNACELHIVDSSPQKDNYTQITNNTTHMHAKTPPLGNHHKEPQREPHTEGSGRLRKFISFHKRW